MRFFRYLPPSPQEQKGFYTLAFGSFLGQLVAFIFLLMAPNSLAGAVAIGGGLAILARFAGATWQFDKRRRRAKNGGVELSPNGLNLKDETGRQTFVSWTEITNTKIQGGKLEIEFRGNKWKVGARELENGMELLQEIARRTSKGNFIPLSPK